MKKLLAAALLSYVFCLAPAHASPQQDKMKACNESAKGMKGEERKTFMSSCLSNKKPDKMPATDAVKADATAAVDTAKSADPKQRMKDCNASAKGKKGEERKAFMSECLKK